jgi:hypothetical protein
MSGLGLSSDEDEPTQKVSEEKTALKSTSDGLGLESDEDEVKPPKKAPAPKVDGLGLDSDEDEDKPPKKAPAPKADGLGLDSDEDEDEPPKKAPAPRAEEDDGLGLDSDEDEEEVKASPAAANTKASIPHNIDSDDDEDEKKFSDDEGNMYDRELERAPMRPPREPKHYTYHVPKLPRPKPSAKLHITKFPPQLGVETKEFGFTKSIAEMKELAQDELGGEAALKELEAVNRFVNQDYQSRMLWRYVRTPDGEIDKDDKDQPKR